MPHPLPHRVRNFLNIFDLIKLERFVTILINNSENNRLWVSVLCLSGEKIVVGYYHYAVGGGGGPPSSRTVYPRTTCVPSTRETVARRVATEIGSDGIHRTYYNIMFL